MNREISIALIAGLALGFSLSACEKPVTHPRKPVAVEKKQKVVRTSDKRYAYEDTSGTWWWYYYLGAGSDSTTSAGRYYTGSTTGSSAAPALPVGGSWGKGPAPSTGQMKGAEEEEIEVAEEGAGQPAVETENEGQTVEIEAEPAGTEGAADGGAAGGDGGGGGGGDGGGD